MTTLDFTGVFSLPTCLGVSAVLAALSCWVYYSQLREVSTRLRWTLPTLRALAIMMCLLMLASPVVRHRTWSGTPNQVDILLDGTQSMQWHDSGAKTADGYLSRLHRAIRLLLVDEPRLLSALRDRSEVTVSRFGESSRVPLWMSTRDQADPLPGDEGEWLPETWGSSTAMGDVLSDPISALDPALVTTSEAAADTKASDDSADCVVLLTDGRNNAGRDPFEAARQLAAENRKLFIVGYGATEEPFDLAVTSLRTPDRVLKTDLLRGELSWKDQFPIGHPLRLQIHAGGKMLWEQVVASERRQQRSMTFSIPVSAIPLGAQTSERGTEVREQTVTLQATVEAAPASPTATTVGDTQAIPTEVQLENNSRLVHLRVVDRQYRILIVDSRARWETRYLRNALERDPSWHIDAFVIDSDGSVRPFSESSIAVTLPQSFEDLVQYDLVIMGELPFGGLPGEWMPSLHRYIADSGGGLIVLDGPHGLLRDAAWHELHALLPIQWTTAESGQLATPATIRLAQAGESLEALQLETGSATDQAALWSQLPGVLFAAPVKAHPGAETLLELSTDSAAPMLVTQRFGAGRVLYLSTDQTWRWRYGVADRYHQRWWNQLARWAMRMPFAMQNEYLQLTTDRSQYAAGTPVLVTARLRDQQGRGVASGDVQVHCRHQLDERFSTRTVSMQPDPSVVGLYRAEITTLPAGEYAVSVTAAGIPDPSLNLSCPFAVSAPDSAEYQELSCHDTLLRELATMTGGAYLPEASADQLIDMLLALSNAEAVETLTALAESYFWFVPLVMVLAIEWWLRKRAGLL